MRRRAGAPTPDDYESVRRFVRRRTPEADAEDVTQEVFANMAELLAQSAEDAPPTLGWLYTVARRRIVDQARARARLRTAPLEHVAVEAAHDSPYGPLVGRAFDAALLTLTEEQRAVVLGRLIRGYSFAEIAEELEITEEACRMRFLRGLKSLRREFEKEGWTP